MNTSHYLEQGSPKISVPGPHCLVYSVQFIVYFAHFCRLKKSVLYRAGVSGTGHTVSAQNIADTQFVMICLSMCRNNAISSPRFFYGVSEKSVCGNPVRFITRGEVNTE